jgi:hypothetical protein
MIDVTSNKPLTIEPLESGSKALLRLPASQVEKVERLFDQHGLNYWLIDQMISMDGGPFFARIVLGSGTDFKAVQAILDNAQ